MNRIGRAFRFGSSAKGQFAYLPSPKVGEDMLSRCHEVPDFRISSRSPSRWAVVEAWLAGLYALAACEWLAVADPLLIYEIAPGGLCRTASGGPDEVRACALMDLKTGAGETAPGGDLAGMGQPKTTKETK